MNSLTNTSNPGAKTPVISITIAAISLLLYFCKDAGSLLQYDRTLIASGELWRIVTGHMTHWSFDHLLWCTITFVALGYICEGISRRGFLATLVITTCIIPAVLWLTDTGPQFYRGLSGLDSAIFIFGALMMMHQAYKGGDQPRFFLAAAGGLGYLVKIIYEFISGSAVFVKTNEIFSPVPLVHLAGGMVGLLVVLIVINKSHRQSYNLLDSAKYA